MSKEKKTKTKEVTKPASELPAPIQQIEELFKGSEGYYGSIYEFAEAQFCDEEKITTGSAQLDMHLDGGFNAGSISLFYGDEESGKTAQAMAWGANWQKHYGEKGWVILLDAEGRMTKKKFDMSGVDISRFIAPKSNSSEDALQNIQEMILNNPHGFKYFFIIDSINAFTTKDERGKTLSEAEARAGVARVTSMAFKKLSLPIHVLGHHLYLCSQVRATNMTGFGGSGGGPSGGKAAKFYGDLNAKMGQAWDGTSPKMLTEGDAVIGRYTRYEFKKSYNEVTGSKIDIPIKYNHIGGVWREAEILDLALAWGVILQKGSWMKPQEELLRESAEKAGLDADLVCKSIQGKTGYIGHLEDNPDIAEFLYSYLKTVIG